MEGSSGSDQFSELSSWPANQTARVIRPFNQFLVAADIDEGGGRVGTQIAWSHPASSGNVPSSWDYTDRTKDAGTTTLAQGGDYIIDMKPMRDVNIVYKDQSVWSQEFIGGNSTFRFRRILDETGVLARRCIADFLGSHFIVANGDILLHDGVSTQQPFDSKMVNWLFNRMDPTYYYTSFVSVNHNLNEVWVCYPESGQTLPNTAVVWNWKDNTIYPRDLPTNTTHIQWGIVDPDAGNQTFDEAQGTYAEQQGLFDEQNYAGSKLNMLMCDATSGTPKFYRPEYTEQFDGSSFEAYAERTALPLGMSSRKGVSYNPMAYKFVTEIWPIMEGSIGTTITVKVGSRNSQNDSVTWSNHSFVVGVDERVKCRVSGRIIDIRFTSTDNHTWSLMRYTIVYELGGER